MGCSFLGWGGVSPASLPLLYLGTSPCVVSGRVYEYQLCLALGSLQYWKPYSSSQGINSDPTVGKIRLRAQVIIQPDAFLDTPRALLYVEVHIPGCSVP